MADKIKEEIAIWHTGWVGGCNFNLIPYKTIINFIRKNRINEDLPKQSFLFVFILVVIRIVINVRIATSLMTLSAIFTKRLNPSLLRILSRCAILLQKFLVRVLEFTSKACTNYIQYRTFLEGKKSFVHEISPLGFYNSSPLLPENLPQRQILLNIYSEIRYLKGECHEIFDLNFFS